MADIYRLTALLLLSAALALPERALAERMFAAERGLSVAAVPGAASYEWATVPATTTTVTTGPTLRVRPAWRTPVTYAVRAIPPAGSTVAVSPWSDASEPASWWPDPRCDNNVRVGGTEFSCFKTVFGLSNCSGEWRSGACP